MDRDARIYVAGHRGMVGAGIVRTLQQSGFHNLILRSRRELDLRDCAMVARFFAETHPDYVFLAAARVGGILANSSWPADFIHDNLAIQTNVIHQSHLHSVKKLLFLGSSCIYPRNCAQPIREEYLLTGPLEPTNEWYAIAKIAGIKMCQAYRRQYDCDFISAMPTNLYGPGDNFNLDTSHVVPALIRKFHEAKAGGGEPPKLWGTGKPRREFLHVDDCAEACVFLMERYSDSQTVNVGAGKDIPIMELALLIADVIGYEGDIDWDRSKPDGTPRKRLDCSHINRLGWHPRIRLRDGLEASYQWYTEHIADELHVAART